MADNEEEEDMIEAFFDFSKPLKRFPQPNLGRRLVPIPKQEKPKQTSYRQYAGIGYSVSHVKDLSQSLSRVSKFNIHCSCSLPI